MSDPEFPPMEANVIDFHAEDVDFQLEDSHSTEKWIRSAIQKEGGHLGFLHFIFCSDEYLHQINLEFLKHDTYTDIITFPYSEEQIEGDVFISTDRVKENAAQYKVTFEEELYRVMIHGVLHLLGFGDKSAEEKKKMRTKENEYLAELKNY